MQYAARLNQCAAARRLLERAGADANVKDGEDQEKAGLGIASDSSADNSCTIPADTKKGVSKSEALLQEELARARQEIADLKKQLSSLTVE